MITDEEISMPPLTRDYSQQAKNFGGARGSGDHDKILGLERPSVSEVEDALFGDTDTWEVIKREKPVHRLMIELSLQGISPEAVAARTGYNVSHVRKVLRQPFARAYMIKQVKKTVQDEVRELLESQVIPSLQKIIAVRDNPQARGTDILTASNSVLDRFMGKPTTPITVNEKPVEQMSEDELNARTNAILTGFGRVAGAPVAPAS